MISRTSGTTGRPKAVLLRHGGTVAGIDASIAKLRGRPRPAPGDGAVRQRRPGYRQALDVAKTLSLFGTTTESMAAGQQQFRSGRRTQWRLR